MRRSLVSVFVAALVAVGTAAADHLDPQKRLVPADQRRARAMLLRGADLPGYQASPVSGADAHLQCRALDESDLVQTGEAESPQFSAGVTFVSSLAAVYRSRADASTSWRRGISAGGTACLRSELAREFAQGGARLQSLRRISFPHIAQRSEAFRLVLVGPQGAAGPRVYVDLVVMLQGRAQVALFVGTALSAPNESWRPAWLACSHGAWPPRCAARSLGPRAATAAPDTPGRAVEGSRDRC